MLAPQIHTSISPPMVRLLFILHLLTAAASPTTETRNVKPIRIRFFWHNILTGSDPTAVTVARGPATDSSPTRFGLVNVIDDPLTVGPNLSSRVVGRAQGLLVSADREVFGFFMAMNFVFVDGEFNGSTLAVTGRSPPLVVREMAILGGTGVFRFARGYVRARTQSLDRKSGDAVVEYNCYVAVLDLPAVDYYLNK